VEPAEQCALALSYGITQNTSAPRVGIITIAGVRYLVQQQGGTPPPVGCVYPLEPSSVIAPGNGIAGTFQLGTTTDTCAWTAASHAPWIQVFPIFGTNSTTVNYTVYPNFGTGIRSGTVSITGGGGTQTFTVTQANTFLSETQRFVTLLYSNYLGRYPSPAEIDFQTSVLNSGTTRGNLAASFFNTPEFQQGGRFVAGLYVGLLGRDPEFNGWLFQRNALALNIVTQDQLVANFLDSTEFKAKYGPLTNDQFVQLMYVQVLGRNPSSGEIAFHAGLLNAGTLTRVQTARNFLNSDEFRIRLASRLSAFLLYATLLQRDPSQPELTARTLQLETGTPIATLTEQFIASPEFQRQLQ
jgi:hypothetical protein